MVVRVEDKTSNKQKLHLDLLRYLLKLTCQQEYQKRRDQKEYLLRIILSIQKEQRCQSKTVFKFRPKNLIGLIQINQKQMIQKSHQNIGKQKKMKKNQQLDYTY